MKNTLLCRVVFFVTNVCYYQRVSNNNHNNVQSKYKIKMNRVDAVMNLK